MQGLPKFMRCSQLSQERLRLWTSNLAGTFAGSLRAKGHKKFWRQRDVGVSRDCPIFCVTPISSGTLKAMNFKFGRNIRKLNPSKRPLKILETRGRGRSQGLSKIFTAAIYRAHHAVVFAICKVFGLFHLTLLVLPRLALANTKFRPNISLNLVIHKSYLSLGL